VGTDFWHRLTDDRYEISKTRRRQGIGSTFAAHVNFFEFGLFQIKTHTMDAMLKQSGEKLWDFVQN